MAEKKSSASEKKTEAPKKKPVAAKLFSDVKKPSETTASATSKPVITGHQISIKRDPMVAPPAEEKTPEIEAPDLPAEEPEEQETVKREVKIQPLSESEKAELKDEPEATDTTENMQEEKDKQEPEVVEDAKDTETKPEEPSPGAPLIQIDEEEPAEETPAPEESDNSVDEKVTETIATPTPEVTETTDESESATTTQDSSSGAVDAIVENINTKKERDEQDQKQQIKNKEIQDLVDSKKYHVKIRSAPSKRKFQLLALLIIAMVLGGAGWYLGYGPGKSLWLNQSNEGESSSTNQASASQKTDTSSDTQKSKSEVLAFTNKDINTTFEYPKAWKVEVTKDSDNQDFDVVTLTSQNVEVDSVSKDSENVKAGVFLRTKIVIENTKDTKTNASKLVALTNCESEDLIIGNSNLKLLFTDGVEKSPNVSKVSLSPSVCQSTDALFNGDDQVQLSTQQNTYVINTEYVFSQEYLEKIGTKEADAVATAQASGVLTTKDSFKSTEAYTQLITMLKTFKEL